MSTTLPTFNPENEERVTISLSLSNTYVANENLCLIEMGTDALTYSNHSRALPGNLPQLTPYKQIFYTRLFAPAETASSINANLTSTVDEIDDMALTKIAMGVYQSIHIFAVPQDTENIPTYDDIETAETIKTEGTLGVTQDVSVNTLQSNKNIVGGHNT